MRRHYLLITATITPSSDQPSLLIKNSMLRLSEYEKAMAFYVSVIDQSVIRGIVFVENSGFDLRILANKYCDERIEWISAPQTTLSGDVHRGYAEFKMIEFAFMASVTLADLNQDDVVWKVSGRYIIKNLKRIVKNSPVEYDLYGSLTKNWVELSLISWTKSCFLLHFLPLIESLKATAPPETILAKKLAANDRISVVARFNWRPLIDGRRGSDGSRYVTELGLIKHYVFQSINFMRIIFRCLFSREI